MIIQPKTMLEFPSGQKLEILVDEPDVTASKPIGAFTAHGLARMDTSKYVPGKRLGYEMQVISFGGSYEKMHEWAHVNMLDFDNQKDAAFVDALLDLGTQLSKGYHPSQSRTRIMAKDMVEGRRAALVRSVSEITNQENKNFNVIAATLYGTLYHLSAD
jgi:hypothetical protein